MPISNYFISKILNRVRLLNHYDEDDIDVIRYSLEAILWEIEKMLILFIVFLLLGYIDYFLFILLVIISIRPISGGFHSETALGCLTISFLWIFLSIVVLPMIPMNTIAFIILGSVSLLITIYHAPMKSLERASIENTDHNLQKKIFVFIASALWLVWVYFSGSVYAISAFWIIILHNTQLLLEYFRRKRKDYVKKTF